MKNIKANTLNLVLVLLLFLIALAFFNKSQQNARKVETKIDTLSAEIQRMNTITHAVADNLEHTVSLIGSVSENLETSSQRLESLLSEASSISTSQKQKIKEALNDIQDSRKSVDAERQKALQLISELNISGNDPQ